MTTQMMKRAVGTLLLAVVMATAGCGNGAQSGLGASVEEFRLVRDEDGKQVVTGMLVNPNTREIASATINVDLYDQPVEPGVEPVETMQVEVKDVAAGERKLFKETVDTQLRLSGAKVRRILVF